MNQNTRFRHESLQDKESVGRLLKALISGISKGKIVLEDEDGTMLMEPKGLTNLKISASQDANKDRINIRLTWQADREPLEERKIKISSPESD